MVAPKSRQLNACFGEIIQINFGAMITADYLSMGCIIFGLSVPDLLDIFRTEYLKFLSICKTSPLVRFLHLPRIGDLATFMAEREL